MWKEIIAVHGWYLSKDGLGFRLWSLINVNSKDRLPEA